MSKTKIKIETIPISYIKKIKVSNLQLWWTHEDSIGIEVNDGEEEREYYTITPFTIDQFGIHGEFYTFI